jgi:hypothetical protein
MYFRQDNICLEIIAILSMYFRQDSICLEIIAILSVYCRNDSLYLHDPQHVIFPTRL